MPIERPVHAIMERVTVESLSGGPTKSITLILIVNNKIKEKTIEKRCKNYILCKLELGYENFSNIFVLSRLNL